MLSNFTAKRRGHRAGGSWTHMQAELSNVKANRSRDAKKTYTPLLLRVVCDGEYHNRWA
jgi:hypothetical protein